MTFTDAVTIDTQRQALLAWLTERGSITRMEALKVLGILQLPARVFELRGMGWPIETHRYEEPKPDGSVGRYAKYVLPKPAPVGASGWRF